MTVDSDWGSDSPGMEAGNITVVETNEPNDLMDSLKSALSELKINASICDNKVINTDDLAAGLESLNLDNPLGQINEINLSSKSENENTELNENNKFNTKVCKDESKEKDATKLEAVEDAKTVQTDERNEEKQSEVVATENKKEVDAIENEKADSEKCVQEEKENIAEKLDIKTSDVGKEHEKIDNETENQQEQNVENANIPKEEGLRERSPANRPGPYDRPIPTTVLSVQQTLDKRRSTRHLSGGEISANEPASNFLSPCSNIRYNLQNDSISPPVSPHHNLTSMVNSETVMLDGFQMIQNISPPSPAQLYPGSPQQAFSPGCQVVPDNNDLCFDGDLFPDIIDLIQGRDQQPVISNEQLYPGNLLDLVKEVGILVNQQKKASSELSQNGTYGNWSPLPPSPFRQDFTPNPSSPEHSPQYDISPHNSPYYNTWSTQSSPEQQCDSSSSAGTSPPQWDAPYLSQSCETQNSPVYSRELSPQPSERYDTISPPLDEEFLDLFDSTITQSNGTSSPTYFLESLSNNVADQENFYPQNFGFDIQQGTNAHAPQFTRPMVTIPPPQGQIPPSGCSPTDQTAGANISNILILVSPPPRKSLPPLLPKPLRPENGIERSTKKSFREKLDPNIYQKVLQTVWSKSLEELFKPDQDGDTNLHITVCNKKREEVYSLVERCLDPKNTTNYIDIQNKINETALYNAAVTDQSDVVEYLLGAGANPNLQRKDGNTALHVAVWQGFVDVVSILLSHSGINCNIKNLAGLTPLQIAVSYYGSTKLPAGKVLPIINKLLKANASLIHQEPKNLQTVLHMAVENKNLELLKVLCSSSSVEQAINLQNAGGLSAMHMVANLRDMNEGTQCEMIRVLMKYGGNTKLRTALGSSPADLVSMDRIHVSTLLALS